MVGMARLKRGTHALQQQKQVQGIGRRCDEAEVTVEPLACVGLRVNGEGAVVYKR
jgi:hypothetical protein